MTVVGYRYWFHDTAGMSIRGQISSTSRWPTFDEVALLEGLVDQLAHYAKERAVELEVTALAARLPDGPPESPPGETPDPEVAAPGPAQLAPRGPYSPEQMREFRRQFLEGGPDGA